MNANFAEHFHSFYILLILLIFTLLFFPLKLTSFYLILQLISFTISLQILALLTSKDSFNYSVFLKW